MLDSLKRWLGLDGESISLTREQKREADGLIKELVQIGIREDYLSERAGGAFDNQYRHRRCREIGSRLDLLGGYSLMWKAYRVVQAKAGKVLASHLEYAWVGVGRWMS